MGDIVTVEGREPLRFLVFAASLRAGSLNARLAELAAKMIEANGATVDLASMADFDAPSFDGDVEEAGGLPPGAQRFRERLEAANGFVIAARSGFANEPLTNHWWKLPLYVSARGLTTSLMPHPTAPAFQIDFDFLDHRLDVTTVAGATRSLDLEPRPVANFYAAVMGILDDLGVATEIWPMPVEIPDAIPFPYELVRTFADPNAVLLDFLQSTYDAAATTAAWDRDALERPN